MDNPADLLRFLASSHRVSTDSTAAVANRLSLPASAATKNEGFAAPANGSPYFGIENTASTKKSDNYSRSTAKSSVNQEMAMNSNYSNNNSNNRGNPNMGSSSNNNDSKEANARISSNRGITAISTPNLLEALGQHLLQPPLIPTQINGGLLDPQTRLLLETILRLDDQMQGVVSTRSSSNNDTVSSSTSSGQQHQLRRQQLLPTSSQEAFTTESVSSSVVAEVKTTRPGGKSVSAPSSVPMFRLETTSTSSSSSEDDTIQVPCRARGQPPEHNYLTAYFTIKKNEKHGRELVCSFPGCRDGGVKFCYCSYCKVPVARRNFRLRHHHADAKPLAKSKSKSSKHKKKSKAKEHKSAIVDSSLRTQNISPSLSSNQNGNAGVTAAATMAQAGVMAAAAAAAGSARGNANAISSLLLQSFARALNQGQGGGNTTSDGAQDQDGVQRVNMGQQQLAMTNAPTLMEEVSRLGDSSSSTSTSDGSAVRIPCRARGMSLDHTIETAYFTISKNVKHGDELVCSHKTCTASGVKFCWCSFCKIPVAKRNFRIRHHHCDLKQPPNIIARKTGEKGGSDNLNKRKVKQQDVPSTSEDSDLTIQSPGVDEQEPVCVNDDGMKSTTSSTRTKKKRRKVWSKLLEKFPTGGDEESKKEWLAKVLFISDKKTRRNELRSDAQPEEDTKDMAAIYLEKSKKPRKRHPKTVI